MIMSHIFKTKTYVIPCFLVIHATYNHNRNNNHIIVSTHRNKDKYEQQKIHHELIIRNKIRQQGHRRVVSISWFMQEHANPRFLKS